MTQALLDIVPWLPVRVQCAEFPRDGFPLSPQALSRFLATPSEILNGSEYLYLSELDCSVWRSPLAPRALELVRLAETQVARSGYALLNELGESRLERFAGAACLGPLTLSQRTYELLHAESLLASRRELLDVRFEHLLRTSGFTPACLMDLLAGLETWGHGLREDGSQRGKIRRLIQTLRSIQGSSQISTSDPRLGGLLRRIAGLSMQSRARTLWELLANLSLNLKWLPEADVQELEGALQELQLRLCQYTGIHLEDELADLAGALTHNARAKRVLIERKGLDGRAARRLEMIGESLGVTRERVRQLEKKALGRIEKAIGVCGGATEDASAIYAPRLDDALRLVQTARFVALEVPGALRAAGISGGDFTLASLSSAAELFGRAHDLNQSAPDGLQNKIRSLISRATLVSGAISLEELDAQVARVHGVQLGPDRLARLLAVTPDIAWLGETDWLWVPEGGGAHNRVLNRMRKSLCAADSLTLRELRDGIRRDRGMENYAPPSPVLRAICEEVEWAAVSGEVVKPRNLSPRECLEGAELAIVQLLQDLGPVMLVQDMWSILEAQGLTHVRFWQLISHSPCIVRYERSVYGLRGHHVDALELCELVSRAGYRRRSTVVHEFARISEHSVYLLYQSTPAVLRRCTLPVPNDLRLELEGAYALVSEEGAHVGGISVSGSNVDGLRHWFHEWNLEVEDWILLVFNISERTALGFVGGAELVTERVTELMDGQSA